MVSNLEMWKQTADPAYEVSNLGNVRSIRRTVQCGPLTGNGTRVVGGLVLRPFISKSTGYFQVNVANRRRMSVHRLVAEAFCDGYFDGAYVNHKNGIRTDNRAENLEWCTQSENNKHAFRVLGRRPSSLGKFSAEHPTSKPIKMVSIETGAVEIFDCALDAIRKYPELDSGSISRCCNGTRTQHKGFFFGFADTEAALTR